MYIDVTAESCSTFDSSSNLFPALFDSPIISTIDQRVLDYSCPSKYEGSNMSDEGNSGLRILSLTKFLILMFGTLVPASVIAWILFILPFGSVQLKGQALILSGFCFFVGLLLLHIVESSSK
jgi:hypothetical protein